jgi:alkanesulfonate monooxygenase SsuD/methylene tetrahydromethanopterin reductase-like flavin-dependent oxidoreductase (luciferase family)
MLRIGGSIGSTLDDVRACVGGAQAAEAAGLDFVGYGDTQVIYRDCFGVLTAAGLATSRVQLGCMVTNPVTRNMVVLANALATVDDASDGRAYMAIGAGASAVANGGLQRAKPSELATAIQVFRSTYRDAPGADGRLPLDQDVISITWATRKVPVIVHASGPLGLKVAAEHGDGVLLRLGDVDGDELAERIAGIREAQAAGPRAGLPFEVWLYSPTGLGEKPEDHAGLLGVISARAMSLDPARTTPQFREAHLRYRESYDYAYHASVTEPRNVDLLDRLGLTAYMADRLSLHGDEARVAQRLVELDAAGVDRVSMQALGSDGRPVPAQRLGRIAARYRAQATTAV